MHAKHSSCEGKRGDEPGSFNRKVVVHRKEPSLVIEGLFPFVFSYIFLLENLSLYILLVQEFSLCWLFSDHFLFDIIKNLFKNAKLMKGYISLYKK